MGTARDDSAISLVPRWPVAASSTVPTVHSRCWLHPAMKGFAMATSSILGADRAPSLPSGTDVESLGPSDSTDSGSDSVGAFGHDELASDTDAAGTGERAAIEPMLDADSRDILPDHVERGPDDDESTSDDEGLDELAELAGEGDDPGAAADNPDATDASEGGRAG